MICNKCQSTRVIHVSAKCSDLFSVSMAGKEHDGYVPNNLGIGGGDYVSFDLCIECGQMQGTWPLPLTNAEKSSVTSGPTIESEDVNRILEYVRETEGTKIRDTFNMVIMLESVTDIALTMNELIRTNYGEMVEQFCTWLEDWEDFSKLKPLIKWYDDYDEDDSLF